ncbi:MAG: JDVT-CTERM domain-containing protein, partial [Sulfurovum sp.]
ETVTLTEDDVNSSIFLSTISSELTTTGPAVEDGKVNVIKDDVVTVTYVDNTHSDTATTTATVTDDGTDPADPVNPIEPPAVIPPSSGGGGGCTYNPNSTSFDMTLLFMMALGALYPFRRRFIK